MRRFCEPVMAWKAESTDPTLVRFGLLWQVYDWLAEKGLDYQVPILESEDIRKVYLQGGVSGTDFLVCAYRLDQPIARKGLSHLDFGDDALPAIINE